MDGRYPPHVVFPRPPKLVHGRSIKCPDYPARCTLTDGQSVFTAVHKRLVVILVPAMRLGDVVYDYPGEYGLVFLMN